MHPAGHRFARNDAAARDNHMAQRTEGALRLLKKQRVGVIPRHVVPRELCVWASFRGT
jgi:hypothetical protein